MDEGHEKGHHPSGSSHQGNVRRGGAVSQRIGREQENVQDSSSEDSQTKNPEKSTSTEDIQDPAADCIDQHDVQ